MTLKFDFLVVQIVLAHLFYLSMIQWWREAMIGECVHAMPCTMRNTQGLMATQKWWFFFHVEFVEREILLLVERSIPYLWKYSEKGNMIPLVCLVILIIIIGEMDMFDSLIPCTHHFPISMIFFFVFEILVMDWWRRDLMLGPDTSCFAREPLSYKLIVTNDGFSTNSIFISFKDSPHVN